MDNFVSWYEANDVREILLSFRDSKEEIETLDLSGGEVDIEENI